MAQRLPKLGPYSSRLALEAPQLPVQQETGLPHAALFTMFDLVRLADVGQQVHCKQCFCTLHVPIFFCKRYCRLHGTPVNCKDRNMIVTLCASTQYHADTYDIPPVCIQQKIYPCCCFSNAEDSKVGCKPAIAAMKCRKQSTTFVREHIYESTNSLLWLLRRPTPRPQLLDCYAQ